MTVGKSLGDKKQVTRNLNVLKDLNRLYKIGWWRLETCYKFHYEDRILGNENCYKEFKDFNEICTKDKKIKIEVLYQDEDNQLYILFSPFKKDSAIRKYSSLKTAFDEIIKLYN